MWLPWQFNTLPTMDNRNKLKNKVRKNKLLKWFV